MKTVMKKIYKYPFKINDNVSVQMPIDAKVIHVGLDPHDTPCMWAIVDPDKDLGYHQFQLRGTGHELGEVGEFITTFKHGVYIWHVFKA